MLNPTYRYIGLDFETTGLDPSKDEPIQIGIVEIDTTGKVINEYVSLLKPKRDINELKSIVGFITGLSLEQLENAPEPQGILSDIEDFFGEKTILIGHNIAFDLQFLQKFFPSCTYGGSIDTFPLAQTLLHYQTSYALEVLIPGKDAHNALQDTKNALTLFLKLTEKITNLSTKYPILQHYITNPSFSLSPYLSSPLSNMERGLGGELSRHIPKLTKNLPSHTQLQTNEKTINIDTLENQKKYYIGNSNIRDFLERIAPNKNIILTFSNLQKLDIAKNILNDIGLKNIGFLKDEQMIDYEKFEKVLNKKELSNQEINFILKYYSHLEQGLGIIDLNCKYDYQIYHAIKNTKNKARYPIILATHQGLFAHVLEGNSEYTDYSICFFDAERRYKNYNFFLSRPLDMYYTLTLIENLLYKQSLENGSNSPSLKEKGLGDEEINTKDGLKNFYNSFQIFIGQLSIESKSLFTHTPIEKTQSNPIVSEPNFYKTNLLRKQIRENYKELSKELEKDDFDLLEKQLLHIDTIFNTVVTIEKKMSNEEMYFVYSETNQFTSRSEFIEIFPSLIYFFSCSDQKAIHLIPQEQEKRTSILKNINLYDRILVYIQEKKEEKNIFILSTRKEESKQMFDLFYKNKLHDKYLILVENITGGMGKNLFKAKTDQAKIIIGGYAFILSTYASKIPLDEIIVFNIRGSNEQSILDDIQRYGGK